MAAPESEYEFQLAIYDLATMLNEAPPTPDKRIALEALAAFCVAARNAVGYTASVDGSPFYAAPEEPEEPAEEE